MSVTPTNDALIVALDFEGESPQSSSYGSDTLTYAMTIGVHSIERSAQEDTLLVLFNTAISNLVCPVYLCGVCRRSGHHTMYRSSSGTTSRCRATSQASSSPSSPQHPCSTPMQTRCSFSQPS